MNGTSAANGTSTAATTVQPSSIPTPVSSPTDTGSYTGGTEDGLLMVATLFATLLFSIVVHIVYYNNSQTRRRRAFSSAQGVSRDITSDSFEMTSVKNVRPLEQHEQNESMTHASRSSLDIGGDRRSKSKRLEDDGSISVRSVRSTRSTRSRKSRRGLGKKSRKRAAVDDSSLLCGADEAGPDNLAVESFS